jgi:hypothetical protein
VGAWSAVEEARLTYSDETEGIGTGGEEPVEDVRLPAVNISDRLALFLTFTNNPRWPELTCQWRRGRSANDRPDLIARVFHQDLSALVKDVRTVFGPILHFVRATELQTQGLPHERI